jgi:hypothetical protein
MPLHPRQLEPAIMSLQRRLCNGIQKLPSAAGVRPIAQAAFDYFADFAAHALHIFQEWSNDLPSHFLQLSMLLLQSL